MLTDVIDAVNPRPSPGRAAEPDGLPPLEEVARRGALLAVFRDGATGCFVRADFAAALADLDAGLRALVEDVFEEAVEAALHEARRADPLAVAAAVERATDALAAHGLGEHAGRLAAALAAADTPG